MTACKDCMHHIEIYSYSRDGVRKFTTNYCKASPTFQTFNPIAGETLAFYRFCELVNDGECGLYRERIVKEE